MINYPLSFFAQAESSQGIQSSWNTESQNINSLCAIPPEFEGPGGGLSPEDLFAQALTNCFIATFKVYAEKSKLAFERVQLKTELIVAPNEQKKPVMKNCLLNVTITGCANEDKARVLAERAFQSGFILNSVKTELKMNLQFN